MYVFEPYAMIPEIEAHNRTIRVDTLNHCRKKDIALGSGDQPPSPGLSSARLSTARIKSGYARRRRVHRVGEPLITPQIATFFARSKSG